MLKPNCGQSICKPNARTWCPLEASSARARAPNAPAARGLEAGSRLGRAELNTLFRFRMFHGQDTAYNKI